MDIFLDIYLERNLGDDLFLITVLEKYPQVNFHVFCQKDYQSIVNEYPNLKVIRLNKYFNYFLATSKLKIAWIQSYLRRQKISAYLCIGGSIFMQSDNWRSMYQDRLKMWRFLDKQGIPLYILGANFGPYQDQEFIESYRQAFRYAKDICFRDSYSYELFADLAQVRQADDIVFGLNLPKLPKIDRSLGISMIDLSSRPQWQAYQQAYLDQVHHLINQALAEDYQVYLFSFCQSEGDEKAINDLLSRMSQHSKVTPVYYRDNHKEFLGQFQAMELIVATRFHSLILALLNDQAILALNYSKKTQNIIDDHHLPLEAYSLTEIQQIAWDAWLSHFKSAGCSVDQQIQSSHQQFLSLDRLIEGEEHDEIN